MSNDNFWTDEKVKEFFKKNFGCGRIDADIEQFKQEQLSKRDWVVECFQGGSKNWWRNTDGFYTNEVFGQRLKEAWFLKESPIPYDVHSVRRLSDGEIFCVGDEVEYFLGKDKGERFVGNIHFFEIIGNNCYANGNPKAFCMPLSDIQKSKKKVLLTDDNVWLSYDDAVWWVAVKEEESVYCGDDLFDFGKRLVNERMFPKTKNYKYFSTEAATLDYILMNKPMLSVNDVVIMNNAKFPSTTNIEFWISLKQLAKSKMDKK